VKKEILIVLFLICGSLWGSSTRNYVNQQLKCIPKEDCLILERFFRELVRADGLGYVVFGSKPLCLTGYFDFLPLNCLCCENDNHDIKIGWKIWLKYCKKFSTNSFFFFEETRSIKNGLMHCIFFIINKNLVNVLNQNQTIFKEIFGLNFDNKSFLAEVIRKRSVYDAIRDHEGVLGILLGYGAESSMQYHFRDLFLKGKYPVVFKGTLLPVSNQYSSELDYIHPLCFVGDPQSEEVRYILEKNRKERCLIQEIFSKTDFLEIFLTKLIDGQY
jgi:hypothetical protein